MAYSQQKQLALRALIQLLSLFLYIFVFMYLITDIFSLNAIHKVQLRNICTIVGIGN